MNVKRLGGMYVLVLGVTIASSDIAMAQSSAQVRTNTKPQIRAIEDAKEARSPAQEKISSGLLDSIKKQQTGVVVNGAPNLIPEAQQSTPEGVLVDIKANVSPELVSKIQEMGGKVINQFPQYHAIRASVPLEKVETLATDPDVTYIGTAVKARTNAIASEGDIAHMANLARADFGVQGAGVKVGVLSDSIDNGDGALHKAFTTGAMDQTKLTILEGQEGDGSGEGLAMLEIVHAIAPEAELFFATGFNGPAQMAANIVALRDAGCSVIVDDVTYMNESPFQADAISQAVEEVSTSGVLYFSSARNSGNVRHDTSGTWEGDFRDGGPPGPEFGVADPGARMHMFVPGVTLNTLKKAGLDDRVDLFWSDPLGAGANDYDLFVVDNDGHVVRASTTTHTGTQDPYESVDKLRSGESIVIIKRGGAAPRFLHLDSGRAVLRHSTNGNVRGHNASGATNAFSVAAAPVPSPAAPFDGAATTVEKFSSDGPRRMFYRGDGSPLTPGNLSSSGGIILQKPDLTAADGVTTTLPKSSGLNPFFGTSAAAPHAAAIAALMLSLNPKPTPNEVRAALEGSAVAIEGAGINITAGHGIIMARAAAAKLHPPAVPVPAGGGAQGQ